MTTTTTATSATSATSASSLETSDDLLQATIDPDAAIAEPRTSTYQTKRVKAGRLRASAAVLLGSGIVLIGVAVDSVVGDGAGAGLNTSFLLACAATAVCVRTPQLATAVVAAPLLFAGGVTLLVRLSDEVQGLRQLALDVATTLALAAPVLFGGTLLTIGVALIRGVAHLRDRRH